jgi:alpha-1,6-mannosyltransferase
LNFLLAAMVSKSNILLAVVALRVQIILADIGIIYFGKKILKKLDLPIHHIFLYALNPFVIIELTGNLHFEPVMLFFLLLSLYFLIQKKWIWTSILLGVSVSVKLIPFLFVPLFYQWFSKKESARGFLRWIYFGGIVVLVNMLLFLPFFSSDLIHNYTTSVGLWFKNFEFNASIYYILREIGYSFRGWNEIAIIGKIVSGLSILFIGLITFYRENKSPQQLSSAMLIGISFYYFTATTIHPWYIATPVLLCVFTKYRYPVIWSIVIILSYQAYANIPWKENLYIIALEYLIVYGYLIWEISKSRKRDPLAKNY